MDPMSRLSVIKALIRHKNLKNYLEIGAFNGKVLFRVPSFSKTVVDPFYHWYPYWLYFRVFDRAFFSVVDVDNRSFVK